VLFFLKQLISASFFAFGYWQASQSGSSNEQAIGTGTVSFDTLFRLLSETVDFSVVVAASARR